MKPKLQSGKEARERFERTMAALFRAPKKPRPKKSISEEKKDGGK